MIQPEALKQPTPWLWSPGAGTDVWSMFCACEAGDLPSVKHLLERDRTLVLSHYEYRTPLSFAVRANRIDVAEYLLDHGAEPLALGDVLEMARDREYVEMERMLVSKLAGLHGASTEGEPVAAAIRAHDIRRVRQLLDASPALLHAGDSRSNQPIHWAAMTRQMAIIDELLARGADINARRTDGARPIYLVNGDYFYRGWRDVPKSEPTTPRQVYDHLVERGAVVDFWMAAAMGNTDRVGQWLDHDPSLVNQVPEYSSYYIGGGTALSNAAGGGHLDVVRLLLDRGADPNVREETMAPLGRALYSAVSGGHCEIARLLLERGANVNQAVESSADAVSIAIMRGDLKMLELLVAHGGVWDIDMSGRSSLDYERVLATGVTPSIRLLAAHGDVERAAPRIAADPAVADDVEALENAAKNGHEGFVRLMLQHQPQLARRTMVSKPRAMAELLFSLGMDPDRPTWTRRTPLHHFAERGDIESAALYLDHGADIHARDDEARSTPLAHAAAHNQRAMVKFLLERGAAVRLPDDEPWATPLAWAKRRGNKEIVELLEARDSEPL